MQNNERQRNKIITSKNNCLEALVTNLHMIPIRPTEKKNLDESSITPTITLRDKSKHHSMCNRNFCVEITKPANYMQHDLITIKLCTAYKRATYTFRRIEHCTI